jgi:hypothetical protein
MGGFCTSFGLGLFALLPPLLMEEASAAPGSERTARNPDSEIP